MTNTTTATANTDARVLALKEAGATWKFIALEMGYGWNGANMDGGRAKRAYNRAVKAGVAAGEVKLPKTLTDKLAKAQEAKAKPAAKVAAKTPAKKAPAKSAPKGNGKAPAIKRTAKPVAKPVEVAPVVEDEAVDAA